MFWDLYQQHQIHQADNLAREAARKSDRVDSRLDRLDDKIDSLALTVHAMWELLSQHLANPEAALREKIHEIDARDGRVDGKMTPAMRKCVACERTLHPRHQRCMYCGAERLH